MKIFFEKDVEFVEGWLSFNQMMELQIWFEFVYEMNKRVNCIFLVLIRFLGELGLYCNFVCLYWLDLYIYNNLLRYI